MKRGTYIMMGFALIMAMVCMMTSCGDKGKGMANSLKEAAVDINDGKHTEAYIRERIAFIYSHFKYIPYIEEEEPYNPYDEEQKKEEDTPGLFDYDSMFCSTRYYELQKECLKFCNETGNIFIDADHWIMGQDMSEDWSYKVDKVEDITKTTATVKMIIHNFSDHNGILSLRFERGDWYVDDFIGFFTNDEGKTERYSELEEMEQFVKDGLEARKKAKKLVGEWGWVGDECPELLLTFKMSDKGLVCTECVNYRISSLDTVIVTFDGEHLTVNDQDYADYSERKLHLFLSLDSNGDLVGDCFAGYPVCTDDDFEGQIRLRKGYFKYGKK